MHHHYKTIIAGMVLACILVVVMTGYHLVRYLLFQIGALNSLGIP